MLQCVERKLLQLDIDISGVLPELCNLDILRSADKSMKEFTYQKASQKITLRSVLTTTLCQSRTKRAICRHLLSHSSGFGYDISHPVLGKWRRSRKEAMWSGKTIEERCSLPLLCEPGRGWVYGVGTDWAGRAVERVSGLTLEAYFRKNIYDPLSLRDTTFWPKQRPDLQHRMVHTCLIDPTGSGKATDMADFDLNDGLDDCSGGGGLFSSGRDLMTFLQAVMRGDESLLQVCSYQELFKPQLSTESAVALQQTLVQDEASNRILGVNVPLNARKSWSLGGLVSLDRHRNWMGKETMLWAGIPNMIWVN